MGQQPLPCDGLVSNCATSCPGGYPSLTGYLYYVCTSSCDAVQLATKCTEDCAVWNLDWCGCYSYCGDADPGHCEVVCCCKDKP